MLKSAADQRQVPGADSDYLRRPTRAGCNMIALPLKPHQKPRPGWIQKMPLSKGCPSKVINPSVS